MSIIETPDKIHPEEMYLTPEQYKAIKNAQMNKPFKIKNKEVANILQVIGVVKPHEIKVSNAIITEDTFEPAEYKPTGLYLLQLRGDYYIKYRKSKESKERKDGFRKWATLVIALIALFMSALSLVLDYIQITLSK